MQRDTPFPLAIIKLLYIPRSLLISFCKLPNLPSHKYTNRKFHHTKRSNITSPMLLGDLHHINIHALLEPPLVVSNLDVVAAHLPLSHPTVFREGPIFEAIASVPLACFVMEFVPKLYSNLELSAQNIRDPHSSPKSIHGIT